MPGDTPRVSAYWMREPQQTSSAAPCPGPQQPGITALKLCACCGDWHAQDTGERARHTCWQCEKAPLCGGCSWAHWGPDGQQIDLCCPCHGRPAHSPREQPHPYEPRPPWIGYGHTAGGGGDAEAGSGSSSSAPPPSAGPQMGEGRSRARSQRISMTRWHFLLTKIHLERVHCKRTIFMKWLCHVRKTTGFLLPRLSSVDGGGTGTESGTGTRGRAASAPSPLRALLMEKE